MQQDAHEFLNYLLNTIADLLQEEKKQDKQNGKLANGTLDSQKSNSTPPSTTWVHEIFQGTLTNETRCLTCETVMREKRMSRWAVSSWFCMLTSPPYPNPQPQPNVGGSPYKSNTD